MKSILFTEDEIKKLDPHPQTYVNYKSKYLEELSQLNYSNNTSQLPFLDVCKKHHQRLVDQVRSYKYEDDKQLNPNNFQSIFDDPEIQQSNESLKNQYYQDFIVKPQEEEKMTKEAQYVHLCGIVNSKPVKKEDKRIYILQMEELRKEFDQIQKQTKKVNNNEKDMCKNTRIISKLSGSLLSMYNIYFNEIFNAFIDDLLLDEIQYLNNKEIQVKEQSEKKDELLELDEINDQQKIQDDEEMQEMFKELAKIIQF